MFRFVAGVGQLGLPGKPVKIDHCVVNIGTLNTVTIQPFFGLLPRVVVWSPYTTVSVSEISHLNGVVTLVQTAFGFSLPVLAVQVSPGVLGTKSIRETVIPEAIVGLGVSGSHVSERVIVPSPGVALGQ